MHPVDPLTPMAGSTATLPTGRPTILRPSSTGSVGPSGVPRPSAGELWTHLARLGPVALAERQLAADREIRAIGVTFTVYDEGVGVDRAVTVDIIPRIIPRDQWQVVEAGLVQRLAALNLFIDDCYHDQRAVSEGVVPADLVTGSPNFRRGVRRVDPPGGIWAHICGSDLIRDDQGYWYVLEDDLRVLPVSPYLLENRIVTKHIFPEMFRHYSIEPVDPYVGRLASTLASVSPSTGDPTIVVLTPGIYDSAYFEHAFLAQRLGVELVEGGDLVVLDDDCVYARTIDGLEQVDVIPARGRPLPGPRGVPAGLDAGRARPGAGVEGRPRGTGCSAGAGIADDKKVYSYVPEIIRFYLDEEPILWTIPTYRCSDPESRAHVLANLDELVVKPANESRRLRRPGGLPGHGRRAGHRDQEITDEPNRWVAQPIIKLSTAPTLCDESIAPRRVDLRPFTLMGPDRACVTRGGLTRVTQQGSLVVKLVPGRRQQGHLGRGRRRRQPVSTGICNAPEITCAIIAVSPPSTLFG